MSNPSGLCFSDELYYLRHELNFCCADSYMGIADDSIMRARLSAFFPPVEEDKGIRP